MSYPLSTDNRLSKIVQDMQVKYGCHTIILYGSRARGEPNNTSDYDIIAIREKGDFLRDCKMYDNFYLDAFIYSEEAIKNPDISLVRIKDGVVILQKESIGDILLKEIKNIFDKGSPKTAAWEKHEIITWTQKMLQRAKVNDIEGNFRLHWLLHDLLECYFKMRDNWYLGPKESFRWLKANDPAAHAAFETALKSNACFSDVEKLIYHVTEIEKNENVVNEKT